MHSEMLNKLCQTPALSIITSRKENRIKLLLAARAIQRRLKQKDLLYNQGLNPSTTDVCGTAQAENARVCVSTYEYMYAYLQIAYKQQMYTLTKLCLSCSDVDYISTICR